MLKKDNFFVLCLQLLPCVLFLNSRRCICNFIFVSKLIKIVNYYYYYYYNYYYYYSQRLGRNKSAVLLTLPSHSLNALMQLSGTAYPVVGRS